MTPSNLEPSGGDLPDHLAYLVEVRRLKRAAATPDTIVALWHKAVESAHDAVLDGMSIDGALRAAYDAGHAAALALLAAHELRTGSGQGHHEVAFSVAGALGGEELRDLVADSAEIRGLRHGSMYDPRKATVEDRDHALDWMRRTLPGIRRAILRKSPNLSERLVHYPQKRRDSKG
jgi:hypothetical protein